MEENMAKVLVSDDSILTRTMLKNIFTQNGHEVVEAVDGNEAVAKYFEIKPDIVFMDLVMPEKDGLSAIKEIIARDSAACIVVCSADVQDHRVSEAIEAGASDYITKPFDSAKIINVTDKCLQSSTLDEVRQDIITDRSIMKDFVKNGVVRGIQSLSKMINKPITAFISDFRSIQPAEIPNYIESDCIGVNYNLSGSINGSASLLIPKPSALELIKTLTGADVSGQDEMIHSSFNEMGNVFINSFLSTFSDLLDIMIDFEAPTNIDQNTLPEKIQSIQFNEPVSNAYVVKGAYSADTLKFDMFLVICTDIKSVQYKYNLKNGVNYLVIESDVDKSYDMFKYMIKRGYKGFYITRRNPEDIRKETGIDNLPVVWLTTEEVKIPNCICTTSLPKIGKVIESYYSKVKNVILLIDNIKYLVDNNSTGIVNGFVEEMKSKNTKYKNIMMISYDPATFDKEFLSRKDFEIIQ